MPELKPELSNKSKYWIPKHRYYELKHYCLQYPHWKELYEKLGNMLAAHNMEEAIEGNGDANPTERYAIIRAECDKAMKLVQRTCKDAAPDIWQYLLAAVTEGAPFVKLQTQSEIPCSKDLYYDRYRKFFYLLSQRRGI